VVNIAGMSEHIFLKGGQYCRNVIKKSKLRGVVNITGMVVSIIRIGGHDGSEYTCPFNFFFCHIEANKRVFLEPSIF
jgi:hypothetical protein